jgi:adenylyl- and sulfurtransferase ThiI
MAILVRYAEIGIKGNNRDKFERALAENIEACLRVHAIPFTKVRKMYGRIIIETDHACTQLKHVFGIASFSQATNTGATIEGALAAAKPLVEKLTASDTFRISCQRLDKKFPLTSQQVCIQLGEKLQGVTKAKVKMLQPTVDVGMEIIEGALYVLVSRTEGPGGMPVGTSGTVVALIEDDASVLAALLVLKRGCVVVPALLKDVDVSLIASFAEQHAVAPVHIAAIGELDALAKQHRADAIILNDTFATVRGIDLNALALRPLSGYTSGEITNERHSFQHMLDADGS